MQKAYYYLKEPITKLIYDEFGLSGLILYEGEKSLDTFSEDRERLKEIINTPELF